jgi:FtsH-binding integral membrane protein
VAQAATLSPLLFLQPALLARAGLYTATMMGSIAFVGATAKQEKYLYIGGPLLAGMGIVFVSGLAPLVLPVTAARTLMWSERIWLYGGLAVFGGFTLYDVQKILHHARMAQRGMIKKDTVNESIHLELDFLNSKYSKHINSKLILRCTNMFTSLHPNGPHPRNEGRQQQEMILINRIKLHKPLKRF